MTAIDALRHIEADLSEREAAIAAAMELATVDSRTRAAYFDGIAEERQRVITLIDQRLDCLSRSGISHTVLVSLRRAIEAAE